MSADKPAAVDDLTAYLNDLRAEKELARLNRPGAECVTCLAEPGEHESRCPEFSDPPAVQQTYSLQSPDPIDSWETE